jgi:hypothetical protein
VHAKRADYYDYDYDLGCYDCYCDDDDDEDEDFEETHFGEYNVLRVGTPCQTYLEPVYPPTKDVKECLTALWSYEDTRREAVKAKALVKTVVGDFDDAFAVIDAEVRRQSKAVAALLRVLVESRFVAEYSYVKVWYNPAA